MDINGIISCLSPEVITAMKQAEIAAEASVLIAKKSLDAAEDASGALLKALKKSALETGKGVNIDIVY